MAATKNKKRRKKTKGERDTDALAAIARAAIELAAPPPWYKRAWAIAAGGAGIVAMVAFALFERPTMTVAFFDLNEISNRGPLIEMVMKIDQGRPRGVDDVRLQLDFADPIHEISVKDDGTCSGVTAKVDAKTIVHNGREHAPTSATIRAEKCPADTEIVLRIRLLPTWFDAPLRADEASYAVDFDWSLPIGDIPFHWQSIDPLAIRAGEAPTRELERPLIPTRAYPAGVRPLRKADGDARGGGFVLCLDARDYNSLPKEKGLLYSFARPSTRVATRAEDGLIKTKFRQKDCKEIDVTTPIINIDADHEREGIALLVLWDRCVVDVSTAVVARNQDYECSLPTF
jgi:hypothetical protein